ncbi:choice-of-anchor J domain-containing protein [Dokdonella sp.]|uniref:choice-of-anchor J domain-containing protein n=1 Tax=Dokdonella sp. TaxID=2291710 RepID=UPI003783B1E3
MMTAFVRAAAGVLLAGSLGSACAQSFTENFDDISLLAGNGWVLQNNSTPVGSLGWFQGSPVSAGGPFDAWNGASNAYIAANYNNTGSIGTISNWLLTPNRTLRNGDVFQFYTRKPAGGTDYPDRLEVRLSTNGASTNVGSGATATGDFTTLLLSINPSLVTGVYPQVWTQYTITISGLPAPTSGRMAFRYFVTGAGASGSNSDYIGIDNAMYAPYVCPALTISPSTLPSTGWGLAYSQNLSQTGALGAPSYFVTAGALPPGLSLSAFGNVSGTSTALGTFNATVTVVDNSGCSGSQPYSITVNPVAPSAPQNVLAVAGDAQLDLSWSDPSNNGGDPSPPTYGVTCTGGNVVTASGNSPITLTGLVNGSAYTCAVVASNVAGPGPEGTSNSVTPMGNQSILFDAQSAQTYSPGGNFSVSPPASASSGLAVVYGSPTTSVCTVAGATVSIVAAGTCTLTADQPGDAAWNPAPQVEQSLTINPAGQTLTFPSQTETSRVFDAGSTFEISPLASSAKPNSGASIVYSSLDPAVCSVSGTTVTMLGAGVCPIAADQAGNGNFTAAPQVTVLVSLVDLIFEDGFEDLVP